MMESYMKDCMRKLAMWHTRTFRPMMTHDELEPIMATLGFVGLPPAPGPAANGGGGGGGVWKEYVYCAGSARRDDSPPTPLARPRLPYPRVDGLHIYTYRAFIDAVNFYLEMCDFSDLFHIRGMPLHRAHDRNRKWRRIEEDDNVFVYRDGTLDQFIFNLYHFDKNNSDDEDSDKSVGIRDKGNNTPTTSIVPLKDLILIPARLEKV